MGKGLFDTLIDSIFDANWVGRRGEKLTERELNLVRLFGRSGKVLRNVYVPKDNGETSEMDVLFITRKGIFVIESKNYSGWIFGDERSAYWTASLPNSMKNKFYNPIKQNRSHIKWLGQYLKDTVPLFSVVVFSERCELKKVTVESPDIYVIKRDRLYAVVRKIWDSTEDKLDDMQVVSIYEQLKQLTRVDLAVKQAHVETIREKYNKPAQRSQASEDLQDSLICPRCGGTLVLRTAKKGPNTGNSFYGCSNYPKCRYVKGSNLQ